MDNTPFIGMGINPDGPDLPIGLGMLLAQDTDAMDTFGLMDNGEKSALFDYIQGGATGEEAEYRMNEALKRLRNGERDFGADNPFR